MADIQLATQTPPSAPSAGNVIAYAHSTSLSLHHTDSNGYRRGTIKNYSTALQSPSAASRTYLTGSQLRIPGLLQIGTCFRWVFSVTKTAAGIAASTYDICVGTAGTTADTARVSFAKPAGTAAIDEGRIVIECICRGPISASGVFAGHFAMTHNLLNTGHAVIPCIDVTTISAAFDISAADLFVGVCVTSGTSDALTFQLAQAEGWNL